MKEALLYDKLEKNQVKCRLCRHGCRIRDGKRGICFVRENHGGILYSLVYDKVISANVDPIEKKPLFHVQPGSRSFSIATPGCNFRCSFCQNYTISQMARDVGRIEGEAVAPARLAELAVARKCTSIAYTYTEPTIYYELARDTMAEAKKRGLLNVFVTNGYMTRDMLDDSKGLLDAVNVDLKAFNDHFYKKYCKARRAGVMDTLRYMKQLGIWVEVTTLLIPGLNDNTDEVKAMADFIRRDLGPETPWHVSRFFPNYLETRIPPTDAQALVTARQIGLDAGLSYVYTGNLPWADGEKTVCPGCAHVLIQRSGYTITRNNIKDGRCPKCGHAVEGIGI
ncbi:MAG: AmmeMemoRadiSam system radical SAM enzyme [Desulfomonile sp.]|nr:AmmeMemoRadiSam system radical SAM enzyme [Desulfomonile sp.]